LKSLHRNTFNFALIHTARPVISDLLLHGGASLLFRRGRFQGLAHHAFIPFEQRAGNTPGGLVRRNWIGGKKLAARVLIEIRAWINLRVHLISAEMLQFGKLTGWIFL